MRKEIVIVIFIGILIGAIVAFGVYTAQSAINQKQTSTPSDSQDPSSVIYQEKHSLSIQEPQNGSVTDQENITLTGSTSSNSIIAIIAPENEYLFVADENGNFSIDINLIGGSNELSVSSFDQQGNKQTIELTVVYSTSQI